MPAVEDRTVEASLKNLGDSCLLVDVRTPGEFGRASIPGSVNVPLPDLRARAKSLEELAGGRDIALVCRTGQRACRAEAETWWHGPGDVHVLDGGIVAWERAGLPLEHGQGSMSLERQVRIVAGLLVVLGTGLGAWVHPGFHLLAAFVGAGLVHAGVTDSCAMGMLLARLPWNRGPAPDGGR